MVLGWHRQNSQLSIVPHLLYTRQTSFYYGAVMRELITKTRSFRKFRQDQLISTADLHDLINLGRLGGSARNCQPWQYMAITDSGQCQSIFPHIGWAGYLPDWKGPSEGEKPSAYILCLLNHEWLKGNEKEAWFDLGVSSQNLLLGAMEKGIGGCRIGSFSPKIADLFDFPEQLKLSLVIALGYPSETVVLEDTGEDGDIRYYRDEKEIHHVPKRPLDDIILAP
jgi:nitroreductase